MAEHPAWLTSTLWPSATVSDWSARAGATSRLLAVPDVTAATQFLPWKLSSALASARRASDDRPVLRQWKDAAGVLGLLTVGALRTSRRIALTPDPSGRPSLADHVAGELGLEATSAIVLCGPPRANQKPILQLHDRRGRTLAYVKVAWNELTTSLLVGERTALMHLATVDHREFVAPEVLGHGQWAAGSWMAIGPVGVERRRPPQQAGLDRLARSIESLSAGWHGTAADSPFVAQLVAQAQHLPAGRSAVERVLDRHAHGELHLAARHGDFVPWNVLSGDPAPAVWDWERYDDLAPVGSDRFHHRVQVAIQRSGISLPDAVRRLDGELAAIVPEMSPAEARAHLDWYLAEVLVRYEHDAQDNATPRLLDRIAKLTSILEQRTLAHPLDTPRRPT